MTKIVFDRKMVEKIRAKEKERDAESKTKEEVDNLDTVEGGDK